MRALSLMVLAVVFGSSCNCGGRVSQVRVTIDFSPRTLDFGVQAPSQFARRTVTFTAHGAAVTVAALGLRDDTRGSFSLGSGPSMLQPEVPATVEVTYAPRADGADSALLVASFVDVLDEVTVPIVGRAQVAVEDAGTQVDAGVDAGTPIDAGTDAGTPVDAGLASDAGAPPNYGPPNCPVTTTIRDVSPLFSALPAVIWVGSGYVLAVDERVTATSFEISLQRTDARGALVAGPSPISPVDGFSSSWPSVSFSGVQYGITWLDDRTVTRRVYFARADANLQKIPGSEVALSNLGAAAGSAHVVWSPALNEWGVAWSEGQNLFFERLRPDGSSLGRRPLGSGNVAEAGNPLTATPTGWALVSSGNGTSVFELGTGAPVITPLPNPAQRASIAYGAGQLAVAYDTSGLRIQFMRVLAGAIVPNSIINVGTQTSVIRPNLPSLGWNGAAFLVVWSETAAGAPNPLLSATIPPTMTNTANVAGTPLTIRSNAGFNSLAIGSCGFGLAYGVFSSTPDALEVHP